MSSGSGRFSTCSTRRGTAISFTTRMSSPTRPPSRHFARLASSRGSRSCTLGAFRVMEARGPRRRQPPAREPLRRGRGARRVSAPVPVAFFAYRRADLVARTLAALRANGVTLIHAFSDGARGDGDKADVAEVRRVLRSVDWADLRLVGRPGNLGIEGTEAGIVRGI